VGRKRDKGFEMNVLVFVLIVITNVEGEEVKEEFGAWRNIKECVFFARSIALQNRLPEQKHYPEKLKTILYQLPLKAYCAPKYVDPETTKVY
jgi:hypothetical protein|tara:strand:+ start:1118 stop:1393 length:276 start_codon:yes stop_codon:yes gene_type:complete